MLLYSFSSLACTVYAQTHAFCLYYTLASSNAPSIHSSFSRLRRVGALHFLLQIQDKYGVCIANIQQELQEYWEVLEDLHTKVTLQPKKCQVPEDPHTVLTDTEVRLYVNTGL